MQLLINGEVHQIDDVAPTVLQLLQRLGYNTDAQPQHYIVAVNQQIVSPASYPDTRLQPGDSLDVLSVMTGG